MLFFCSFLSPVVLQLSNPIIVTHRNINFRKSSALYFHTVCYLKTSATRVNRVKAINIPIQSNYLSPNALQTTKSFTTKPSLAFQKWPSGVVSKLLYLSAAASGETLLPLCRLAFAIKVALREVQIYTYTGCTGFYKLGNWKKNCRCSNIYVLFRRKGSTWFILRTADFPRDFSRVEYKLVLQIYLICVDAIGGVTGFFFLVENLSSVFLVRIWSIKYLWEENEKVFRTKKRNFFYRACGANASRVSEFVKKIRTPL